MRSEKNEKQLIIYLEDRIDTNNAAEVENEITAICEGEEGKEVILDAEKLTYISSSGLRVIMKVKKTMKEVSLIQVSPEVYEIFDTTGFTQILDVKKAMRQVSIEGCEQIGEGANGTVYRLDPETIIKVFKPHVRMVDIERELNCSKQAFISGLPTAISYDVVKVGECFGTVYEMLDADILGARIMANTEKADEYIDKFTELALQMHHTDVSGMGLPKTTDIFRSRLEKVAEYATEEQTEAVRGIIDAIPERNTMIHGDFHTKNVMIQGEDLMLIDMGDVSMGHPMIEVANCYSVFIGQAASFPERCLPIIGISAEMAMHAWDRFKEKYFKGYPEEAMQLIDGISQLFTLLRAILTTVGRPDMHFVFEQNIDTLVEKAELMKQLMAKADGLFV